MGRRLVASASARLLVPIDPGGLAQTALPPKPLPDGVAPRQALRRGEHAGNAQPPGQPEPERRRLGPGLFLDVDQVGLEVGDQPP